MATAASTTVETFDEARSSAFVDRYLGALNDASLMLMVSIGHRTGLFDAMDGRPPATSEQIAADAALDERYVREWLGAMVTGKVVEYDPDRRTYRLPPEHARWLTRRVSPENLAVTAQWFSVLGHVESEIVEKFKHGGGVHYHCFSRFHEVMAAESAQTVVAALNEHILPLAPQLEARLEAGIDVLDIGCGSGKAACALAEVYPNSRFTGYDVCEDPIATARQEAQQRGLTNVTFETRDITHLDQHETYDLVTAFDVIHDQKAPDTVLCNVHAILRSGGTLLMQDISASSYVEKNVDHPIGTFLYTISTMHCMTVSLAQGGKGLGTVWGEELALKMLAEAGFTDAKLHKLAHDFINTYYIAEKR